MKTIFQIILFAVLLNHLPLLAQQSFDIEEGKIINQDGIEYSYGIRNERQEDSYSRFEVTISAKNKTGCPLFYFKKESDGSGNLFQADPSSIAKFECVNATGKRLTPKSGEVKAKPFNVYINNAKAEGGYFMKNNSAVSSDFIVIVPKGERPIFKVRITNFLNENFN